MLSAGDDYPVHQTAEPIAFAGTDRNFYDRYFFQAQDAEGRRALMVALGLYPQLDIIDAAVCVLADGVQHSLFASRHLMGDRMNLGVGPIRLSVEVPLQRLHVSVSHDALRADLLFSGLHPPILEPRFTRRTGTRLLLDYSRMTQAVRLDGDMLLQGLEPIRAEGWTGTRDRSWGIRPVGRPDPQPPASADGPQFFWLWAPLHGPRHSLFAHSNDDAQGRPWNRAAVLVDRETGEEQPVLDPGFQVRWRPGTRHAASATICGRLADGRALNAELEPRPGGDFFMHGIGYGHPEHGHGLDQGPLAVAFHRCDTRALDRTQVANAHVQTLVAARLQLDDTPVEPMQGLLEQLAIGPHAPSGFTGLFDGASERT